MTGSDELEKGSEVGKSYAGKPNISNSVQNFPTSNCPALPDFSSFPTELSNITIS